MKASELREMSVEEIRLKKDELEESLFNLRFQHTNSQLENPSKLNITRKDIARINTVITEKELNG